MMTEAFAWATSLPAIVFMCFDGFPEAPRLPEPHRSTDITVSAASSRQTHFSTEIRAILSATTSRGSLAENKAYIASSVWCGGMAQAPERHPRVQR